MPRTRTFLLLILPALLLGLTSCISLAEDITPPPGYQPPTAVPRTPTADAPVYPVLPPDPVRGEALYAENCVPCHGENGLGDGPDASGLPNPVAPLGDPALARQAAPDDWYLKVTNGDLQRYMPPFGNLSVSERWDVIAYAYTLSTTPAEVARGQELYAENCAECHGERGQGDGPDAGSLSHSPVNFTDQSFMGARSAADLFESISYGREDTEMPDFSQLAEADRWALTAFLRTLTFAEPAPESGLTETPEGEASPEVMPTPPDAESATPTPEAESPESGTVTISVIAVSDEPIPTGTELTFHSYDHETMTEVYSTTAKIPEDGTVKMEDVLLSPGKFVFATVEHEGVLYGSDVVVVEPETTTLDLTIHFYGRTTDPGVLNAERLHIFFDFSVPDTLGVFVIYIFTNPSGKVLTADAPEDPAIAFTLPDGAANLQYDVGSGLVPIETPDGFGVQMVYPSSTEPYQVLYSFEMPYEKEKVTFALPIAMRTAAGIVLVPEDGVKFKSSQFEKAGMQNIEGVSYTLYNSDSLNPGDSISMTVSGKPANRPFGAAGSSDTRTGLMIGMIALGVALGGASMYLWLRARADENDSADLETPAETPEDVLDAIIALDDLFKDGEIPEEAYRQRRAALKAQLQKMLDEKDDASKGG